jgi:hypothetical protein
LPDDAVHARDPYEFVGLLRNQPLIAKQRNEAIGQLAQQLAADDTLRTAIERVIEEGDGTLHWPAFHDALMRNSDSAVDFLHDFDDLKQRFLDVSFDHERLYDQPEPMLRNLLELAQAPGQSLSDELEADTVAVLEKRLLDAVGPERYEEALELIETGRVSWKLRDK